MANSVPKSQKSEPYSLLNNSRFYVLSATVCVSLIIFFALRIIIVDPRLRSIRVQQYYGLCAVLYWYVLLLMAPVSKLVGQRKWLPPVLFTRRALGLGVAYFATLHFVVGITGQLGGWHGIWLLPQSFKFAVLFGFTALLVLWVMAALSIDAVVARLNFRNWKLLGQISYIASLLVIVHVWMIGTHIASLFLQLFAFQALAVIFGLETWRYGKTWHEKGMKIWSAALIAGSIWLMLTGGLLVMRTYIPSYANNHSQHLEAGAAVHAH